MKMMNDKEKLAQDVFHAADHDKNRRKSGMLWGYVLRTHHEKLLRVIHGNRILDVGAGYGELVHFLKEQGLDAVGIEPNQEKIACGRSWYGLELLPDDVYATSFNTNEFDSVILTHVVFHLDFPKALKEISRICRDQVIVFQGNSVFLRKIAQIVYRHREFNEKHRRFYEKSIEDAGFVIEREEFGDTVGLALSGGLMGAQLIPHSKSLYKAVVALDALVVRFLRLVKLDRFICLSYLISARKKQ